MLTQPTDLVNSLGYLGIFLSLLLLPIPQEIVLPLAGFMAAQGKLNLAYAVMSGVMGSALIALPWYWAGRYLGAARLVSWAERQRWINSLLLIFKPQLPGLSSMGIRRSCLVSWYPECDR